ncbi:EAL domain-containing protein [Argonema antarcticum]|uniref:EAL domain-containing protein n=1 Tax=Argonema antarcticum TaxID=2942763 RepID=UPI0020121837|nr:EAL domain-containing protein [Argonema antarcticum]MCL1469886.1 EAL domain-containing protein [Argonema antarcticum A004/B2]
MSLTESGNSKIDNIYLKEDLMKANIFQILEQNLFFCEYQPIVCPTNNIIHAYEALARFKINGEYIPPDLVFGSLHQDKMLFFKLESRIKNFQICHRPANFNLFLNLDPHVCEEDYQLEYWLSTFSNQVNLVVEIIENTSVSNLYNIKKFMQLLGKCGIKVALDDIGGINNLFSFELLEYANYLKFDRRWFELIYYSESYKIILQGLIAFAKSKGNLCIFEGVETEEQLKLAGELGVDYVQGFLFRDRFILAQGNESPNLMDENSIF